MLAQRTSDGPAPEAPTHTHPDAPHPPPRNPVKPPVQTTPRQILRNDGTMRPLVVTTVDRLDLVLGLMGAQARFL
jgi:hypothetical protein